MFAIIQVGTSQYKVTEGDTIQVDRLKEAPGKAAKIDKVLMFAKGNDVRVGQPYLDDVKITAKVVEELQGDKVVALKYRRRKDSATKIGNRAKLTALNITKIAG